MKIKIYFQNRDVITSASISIEDQSEMIGPLHRPESISYLRFEDEINKDMIWIIPGELLRQSAICLIEEENDKYRKEANNTENYTA
jgi:hypothetical protein